MNSTLQNLDYEFHGHIHTVQANLDVIETLAANKLAGALNDDDSLYQIAFTAVEAAKEAERVFEAMEEPPKQPNGDLGRAVANVFFTLQQAGVIETSASAEKISILMESVFREYSADPEGAEWQRRLRGCMGLMTGKDSRGPSEQDQNAYETVRAAIELCRKEGCSI